ncbi:MAG TPA: GyrI-like domain-containing protein [Rugosimonospora sp.]|nr:GyrI-like domain-containing protein [Rugosimonospora sp.]
MTNSQPVEPAITDRPAQPYVAVRQLVTMRTIPEIADRLPEVFGWLAGHGAVPAGAPFLKYNVIDMERELEIEAGVPVAAELAGERPVFGGVLPAGRYVTLTHHGHPAGLVPVVAGMLAWAGERGLRWDSRGTDAGEWWGCRLEIYHTDPAVQPDLNKWATELAFRLAD